ncbi:uncharacterized protein LOC127255105 isoform X2 [Andrographis paniculata]|uniref:uncharacterized protein LOC127255105 isoform X2 n=1 Tax=Andrographis paniculata TaxID=175694 RepID=UPI0021E8D0B3|nr:uncharacterized protein LOC127255105 isoform X2 [Andrographis paniculata]
MEMGDSSPVDVILEFLRRNKFTKAESALRSELRSRPDLNGILQKLMRMDEESGSASNEEVNSGTAQEEDPKVNSLKNFPVSGGAEASKEVIVKEVQCRTGRHESETKWKSCDDIGEQSNINDGVGTSDRNFAFSKDSDENLLDLYSWKPGTSNGLVTSYQKGSEGTDGNKFSGFQLPGNPRLNLAETLNSGEVNPKSTEHVTSSGEKRLMWPDSGIDAGTEIIQGKTERKEIDLQRKSSGVYYRDENVANPWSRSDASVHPSSESWKECPVKTIFPFPIGDTFTSYDSGFTVDKKEGKRKTEFNDVRAAIKEQVDEVGRAIFFGKAQGGDANEFGPLEFHLTSENHKEELPRLPPVRLKSEDKPSNTLWEEKYGYDGAAPTLSNVDNAFAIGSFLDVPIGQEINPQGDGMSESIDYPNEYWDSDEYEDDDDVGYMRQPIEDETWFLAHEIDYPSDVEKGTGQGSVPDPNELGKSKNGEDDQSFAEEDSYFSGERYFQSKNVDAVVPSDDPLGLSASDMYRRKSENDLINQYDGQLMDEEELNLMRAEPVWQGFVTHTNELIMLGDGNITKELGRLYLDDMCLDDDQHDSVRSIGVGINSNAADIGSEVRESLVGGSSEADHDVGERSKIENSNMKRHDSDKYVMSSDKGAFMVAKNHVDGGFSFPPPVDGQLAQTSSSKSLWLNQGATIVNDEADDCGVANGDMLAPWRRNSNGSSPAKSSRDDDNAKAEESASSSHSSPSNRGYSDREHVKEDEGITTEGVVEDPGALLEDEEAAAVQEQVKQIKAQEEEFETFDLKIVHRKNRTGFEEDKNFHVVLNSVIAGRYHVTEYLGSAAFSKAIQAHDLHTGMDVCVKIIKNNKDFFDQSLDEIKLLKYVNKHDPGDKYHILRLYDYFYYREHLLIVCELLKANLYEFHKFNRESGGEVYFTMPRLQSITIQCLEALQFLHSLGLIHCDLKPENILVKSYSRCEVKVIDLGSSCFETDHLCSYVQSRSYRAPEVILGLPYDKKIDIWSLGCILAELCTGNVLFQNDSPATLLARVIGIIGSVDQEMLAKGRETYKYFTKNHMLYERNQDTNRLEYLIPKKSSLRHRLPMGDQGFIDFVAHLLEVNPSKRPSASEALKHPWLQYPYEPISS